MQGRPIFFYARSPAGDITSELNVAEFARAHNLKVNNVRRSIKSGGRVSVHGWRFSSLHGDLTVHDAGPASHCGTPEADAAVRTREELKRRVRALADVCASAVSSGSKLPFDPQRVLAAYRAQAEVNGVDWKSVEDTRSDAQVVGDAIDRVLSSPESIFELTERELLSVEAEMIRARDRILSLAHERVASADAGEFVSRADPKAEVLDRWAHLFRRLTECHKLAAGTHDRYRWGGTDGFAARAGRPLFLMLWVGRSDIDDGGRSGGVFNAAPHLCRMALDCWEAESGAVPWPGYGWRMPGHELDGRSWVGWDYEGWCCLAPPRHSKTTFERHWVIDRLSHNPRSQGAYLHSRFEEAEKFLAHVGTAFDRSTGTGRRLAALFPGLRLAKKGNTLRSIRLENDDPTRSHNLIASSIMAEAQGNNFDFLIADDVVPQSDATSPTDRQRRLAMFRGTWSSRFQGRKPMFKIISGYPYHHDDLVWTYREGCKRAERNINSGVRMLLTELPVGGPNTDPPFFPLWPDMYPASRIARLYREVGDAAIWSANFMLNPITDELRIVREVAWYDPEAAQHRKFLDGAVFHLSVDSASTGRPSGDKSGLVLVAVGDVVEESVGEDGVKTVRYARRIRVVSAEEFHATQTDLAARMAEMVKARRVDVAHVEISGGYGESVRDQLADRYGIDSLVQHRPGDKGKEARLRRVAGLLEAGSPGIVPPVEFPAAFEDGRPRASGAVRRLVDEVVNFRVVTGHHMLDALTQVVRYLAPEVASVHNGTATVQALRHERQAARKSDDFRSLLRADRDTDTLDWAMGFACGSCS